MNLRSTTSLSFFFAVSALMAISGMTACRNEAPETPAAAHVEHAGEAHESELSTLTLSPEAYERLGITTAEVTMISSARTRVVAGFVTSPVGGNTSLSAPLAGVLRVGDVALEPGAAVESGTTLLRLVPLAPVDRDLRAQATRQRDSTRARVKLATSKVDRTRKLLDNKASSQRLLEEALAELEVAQGDDKAALARERSLQRSPLASDVSLDLLAPVSGLIRTIAASPGQAVAAGAPLLEIASDELWLRVPIYAGDIDGVALTQAVRVARLGHDFGPLEAKPVLAPPSADPLSTTVDRFYALPADSLPYPGERVLVELPFAAQAPAKSVPASALIVDAGGGTWVYECLPERKFRRRRVEVTRQAEGRALLERGPEPGTCVVEVGALELFGAEFGVKH